MNITATVFVVDHTQEVRMGLARLLGTAGYQVRGFESAEHFLRERDADAPGCLLLDVWMPGLNGLELQTALARTPCAPPIVFLTGRGDIQTSVLAMKAGAVDFLTKPIDNARLYAAIDQALRFDAERRLEHAVRSSVERRFASLTPRERQVMSLVVRGRLNKQIAAELGTGEKTIKVHRVRVMAKMRARSVAQLVRLGSRAGIAVEPLGMAQIRPLFAMAPTASELSSLLSI